jgi:hypothetical protein
MSSQIGDSLRAVEGAAVVIEGHLVNLLLQGDPRASTSRVSSACSCTTAPAYASVRRSQESSTQYSQTSNCWREGWEPRQFGAREQCKPATATRCEGSVFTLTRPLASDTSTGIAKRSNFGSLTLPAGDDAPVTSSLAPAVGSDVTLDECTSTRHD